MNLNINILQILSSFVVLFALIDVLGSVPLFLSFKLKEKSLNPFMASLYAMLIMLFFLFVGHWLLKLFHVDESSFAVAGAVFIFIISVEIVFGVRIFKNDAPDGTRTFVPVVFPLIAGPAVFTTLLSMRAEFQVPNIIIAIVLNMVIVYFVLKNLGSVDKLLGRTGMYVVRKFFGIILMAISVHMFVTHIMSLFQ